MDNQVVLLEEMKQLGLNQYESKAYLKLLETWPVNGYNLSKNSGVPRSRIYEVLDNLVIKQFVFEKKTETGTVYYPLEPDMLVKKLKKNYESLINHVEKETSELFARQKNHNESKVIIGRNNIFEFIEFLVEKAQTRIDVSLWQEEYSDLKKTFDQAIKRGVAIKGVFFGDQPFAKVVPHRRRETYLKEKDERYIIIIIDQKEAITGIISRGEESSVTWTNDYGVIDISQDYIVHDLMINEYSNSLSKKECNEYEAFLYKVRKNFFSDN